MLYSSDPQHVAHHPLWCCSQWPQSRCPFLNFRLEGKFWKQRDTVLLQAEPSTDYQSTWGNQTANHSPYLASRENFFHACVTPAL